MKDTLQRGPGAALRQFFGVPLRAQTYRNLAYLVLAFPLGLAYFVGLTAGISTGLSLTITLVGIPLLVVTVAAAAGVAGFEAKLATWLVGVEATPPAALRDVDWRFDSLDELVAATKRLLTETTTWTGLLLVLLKFVFGILAFTALVTTTAVAGSLLAAPLVYDAAGVTYLVGPYAVETLAEALAVAGVGVLATFVSLHVLNGLAKLGGFTTAVLLGGEVEPLSNSP
jgi:hypothetical protein